MQTKLLHVACWTMPLLTGTAMAQTQGLYNGGFENDCFFCDGPFADGWHSPGSSDLARRRKGDDGAFPPVAPRSGVACLEIGTEGVGFYGVTTDTLNFCHCDQTCVDPCTGTIPYFDPFFDYFGGDVIVSGFYMIPSEFPIINDTAGIKLNIKRGNQDVATLDFDFDGPNAIRGDTNGEWVPHTVVFSRDAIQDQYDCNTGRRSECGCGCVASLPLPDHVKIVIGRFAPEPGASGLIFWDDIVFTQLPGDPCDSVDFNNDQIFPDSADLDDFFAVLSGGPEMCSNFPLCNDLDFNNDQIFPDSLDLESFLSRLGGGPCLR